MRVKVAVFLTLLVFSFTYFGFAEEEEKIPIICHGDSVVFLEAEQRVNIIGHVVVTHEDVKITCDKMTISMATKEGIAEGDVRLYQDGTVVTGNKATYNFDTKIGKIYEAGFISQEVYGKGPVAVKDGPNSLSMKNSYMTTCDLAEPHYKMQSKTIRIYLGDKMVMKHVVIYVFNVPAFYLPYFSYSLKEDDRPKVTVLPGKDSDWGYYVLSSWRYEFNRYLKGILRLDYREKRDFASGFANYYDTIKYGNGFIKTYYMNERKLEGAKRLWNDEGITYERERYLIHQRHSWEIDPDTDLQMEYWGLSDTTFLQDYFLKDEFEREDNPESYISIVRNKQNYSLSFLGKRRFNKIFTRTEYQPEVKINVPGLRIKNTRYYWGNQTSFANISRKIKSPSDVDDDVVRFDTYNDVKRISKLGFLNITPYVGTRQTYYSKDKYGEHDWVRGAFYTGVNVETKFYRIFNVSSDIWGMDINNLRHVITPRVGYGYVHTPTIVPEKLFQFDGLDAINSVNRNTFSLENKLQTKRKVTEDSSEYQSVDLARLLISTNYNYRLENGSRFGNINFDFEFTPFNWLTLEFDTFYDHRTDRFETFNLDIFADQSDKWRCGLGYRYAHENHSEVTFELSAKPLPLWKLSTYQRFLFKGYPRGLKTINSHLVQEYRLVRDLHCWTSEILYTFEKAEGESSIYFVLRLKAFPDLPLEVGTSYSATKPGLQNPIR